ncbi:MAG TPA: glutaredoxin 3 [Methyloceanibacter sp.]|nr:glutaredoxin 3 [Methyloceanibacter sp.]
MFSRSPRRGIFGSTAVDWQRSFDDENILYATPSCGYCRAVKHLLTKKGATLIEVDVSEDFKRRHEMIARPFGRRTVPQIFINGSHVGGYDELAELQREAKLDALLAEVAAVAPAPGE